MNRNGANARVVAGIGATAAVVLLGLGLFFAFGDGLRAALSTGPSSASLAE